MINNEFPDALPPDYKLHWYVLERVLGQGGFGITYVARDTNLDTTVAIKEYLPVDVATRRADSSVRSRTEDQADRYRGGLERFIREARTLARFDHANIVRVHSVFEFNGTAYMVMRFEKGETLAALLERRHALPESELVRIVMPILDGLELVHGSGFIHRDIKPDNILIRVDGSPVLLDFGSARLALGRSHTVTILVAPGYAPIEQYYNSGESQGPWTDIYGLGATCYRAIAGHPPLDAIARSKGKLGSTEEMLLPALVAGNGRYSDRFLRAVDSALEFSERDRPQAIGDWRRMLLEEKPAVSSAAATRSAPPASPVAATPSSHSQSRPWIWAVGGAASVLAVLAVLPFFNRAESPPPAVKTATEPAAVIPVKNNENVDELRKQLAELKAEQSETQSRLSAIAERAAASEQKRVAKPEAPPALKAAPKIEPRAEPRKEPTQVAAIVPPPAPAEKAEPSREPIATKDPMTNLRSQVERNDPVAMVKLGDLYARGEGIERSDQEAARLFRKAADAGNSDAQLRLGDMYSKGRGVPQNNFQAYLWYSAAARGGNGAAKAGEERTALLLQPAEIKQARRLVDAMTHK
jgi:serine/threonine protein kinase